MARVSPQSRTFRVTPDQRPTKQSVLSLTVPKRPPPVETGGEAVDSLTTSIPRKFRRFQASSIGTAKQVRRFCRCGCEIDLNVAILSATQLRIATTPGTLIGETGDNEPCIHLAPALRMTGNTPRKPKERRGVPPVLVARRAIVAYDW